MPDKDITDLIKHVQELSKNTDAIGKQLKELNGIFRTIAGHLDSLANTASGKSKTVAVSPLPPRT